MLYSREQIKNIIPYSDPFLWVDEIEKIENETIVGYKHTSPDNDFFKGHFVDFPIMPGVLVVEGIAQTGTLLLREKLKQQSKNKHLLAYQVRSAFFYEPIWPGDKIEYQVKMLGIYQEKIANFLGQAFVNNKKKCEVRFSVAIVEKKEMEEKLAESKQEKEFKKFEPQEYSSLPPLKIGKTIARIPIIQGGMAVRVSLHNLAGTVAKEGGIGIVAISGMQNIEEVKSEIKQAREIAGPEGVIGVNIMGVVGHFKEFVKAAAEEGVDLIIQGAGFREDTFEIANKYNIPVLAIASSVKVAEKAEKAGAAAVVIEGCDAGGHLGFPEGHEFRKTIDIVKEASSLIKIPIIAAGGIFNGQDIVEMLRAGAKGVQMATRFVATNECDADIKFKQAYIDAKDEDLVIIKSPVGLPGRAIKTPFVERLLNNIVPKVDLTECVGCIGPVCDKSYCILKALESARKGDLENGLVFAGTSAGKIKKIVSVKELINELVTEANAILEKQPLIINK
jgi:NAD(P)H-dependent flavin oxidoreductase YrpB (nitropropane dioxygenase family)/3-hydroxymyristoyl/3-hydroxydecanoyl-(acyl carrier protein) dehydratase